MGVTKYADTTRKSGGRAIWTGKVKFDGSALSSPLKWRKPKRIFVNSMSDLFQTRVPERFIRQVWDVMEQANWHTFQILTKRPDRMGNVLSAGKFPTLKNVWLGTSVENQESVERISISQETPAHLRFISFEPLIGPIIEPNLSSVHWAIFGGESGPGARPMEHWWVEELRDAFQFEHVKPCFIWLVVNQNYYRLDVGIRQTS